MYTLEDIRPSPGRVTRNASPPPQIVIAKHGDAVVRWSKLKQTYIKARGGHRGADNKTIPHTTNADVMQIATLWSREVKKVKPRNPQERTDHKRWKACMDKVAKTADPSKPDERYADNENFWQQCTARLAIYLESRKVVPSEWSLFKEALVESIAEVPGTFGRAGQAAAEVVGNAAGAVGRPAMAALAILGGVLLLPPIIRAVRE